MFASLLCSAWNLKITRLDARPRCPTALRLSSSLPDSVEVLEKRVKFWLFVINSFLVLLRVSQLSLTAEGEVIASVHIHMNHDVESLSKVLSQRLINPIALALLTILPTRR